MLSLRYALWLLASIQLASSVLVSHQDTTIAQPTGAPPDEPNADATNSLTSRDRGELVSYTLTIRNTTCNFDGSASGRICLLVNGQYPGPTLRARLGDTLQVTIVNRMQDNGTAIHFHGVRQLNSPGSDGVAGISQCAIAPGDTATYRFQVTQYGTSWYHSHVSAQYGDGVLGSMVFDGPIHERYDVDLGPYLINDWYSPQTAWQVDSLSQEALNTNSGPPLPPSILINGTSRNIVSNRGEYNVVKIQRRKRYRLRLINASTLTYVRVSLDNHSMLVIAADFVPIQPFKTTWLLLGIGQRYDVLIDAEHRSGSYWFRANWPFSCYGLASGNGTAIWTYDAEHSTPSSHPLTPEPTGCLDETFVPLSPQSVPSATYKNQLDIAVETGFTTPGNQNIAVWTLENPIWTNYSDPTIGYLMRGDADYPKLYNAVNTRAEGRWNYWLIINNSSTPAIPHPIHLHGHDMFVIGTGVGSFHQATAELNWRDPIQRDTQSVPGYGWLAVAFKSDNPGVWLMHCHIAYHIAEGLGLQYVEDPEMAQLPDLAQYRRICSNWNKYQRGEQYHVVGSGL